jgi:phosphate transport system substrate-binding protein
VAVRLSFSGSGTGIIAVDGSTPVSTRHPVTGNLSNAVPDVAFSDIFPESTTPPVNGANLERSVIGVIPFVFVKNNALTGINNLTKEQATLLFTASGVQSGLNGMPANFLGGADANPIYFTGRDSGSGTRISVHKDVGFTGTPVMWSTNNAGGYIQTAGFSSGGTERNTIANGSRVIGYLGEADALTIASSATVLTYNGVAFSHNNVATGKYPIWGYENVVNRVGGLSANQGAFRDALLSNCTYSAYQNTAIYSNAFVPLSDMQVERGTDGGTITSLNF